MAEAANRAGEPRARALRHHHKKNILLGRPDASLIEIEEASRVANTHSFIVKLPDGYDTQVGERGLQLSGGQKQSALDSDSEKLVQETLDHFMIGRTTLVIAHRLSTTRKADLVAIQQQGSVFEIGAHDEFMAKGEDSVYAKLIRMHEAASHETAFTNVRKSSASLVIFQDFTNMILNESPVIKQKRSEEWALAKKQEITALKEKKVANMKLIFNRAQQYAKEYIFYAGKGFDSTED